MKRKNIDYGLKSRIIASGIDVVAKQVNRAIWAHNVEMATGEIIPSEMTYEHALQVDLWCKNHSANEWNEAFKINSARHLRTKRLRKRIETMLLSGRCLFLTLTFKDDVLSSTSAETRRQYVRKCLKSYNTSYVANIDYGGENGREHYHAVILLDNFDNKSWQYGAVNFKRIRNGTNTPLKLAKYVAKLTNHAIKETTKRNNIIYSRD